MKKNRVDIYARLSDEDRHKINKMMIVNPLQIKKVCY